MTKRKITVEIITEDEYIVTSMIDALGVFGYDIEYIETSKSDEHCLIVNLKKEKEYEGC